MVALFDCDEANKENRIRDSAGLFNPPKPESMESEDAAEAAANAAVNAVLAENGSTAPPGGGDPIPNNPDNVLHDDEMEGDTPTGKHHGFTTRPLKYIFDLDKENRRGISETHEYTEAIAKCHIKVELENLLEFKAFLSNQTDVKPRMRTILFMWLVDVHRKFCETEQVLWRTFEIIDRYLAVQSESRDNLQLIACAALWIASKYHEIYPPTADDLVHVSAEAFTKISLIKMEVKICQHFKMQFTYPTAFDFLNRYTTIALPSIKVHPERLEKMRKRVKYLARYGMERSIMDISSLEYRPSLLAACSLFTALSLTNQSWNQTLTEATGYSAMDLREKYSLFGKIKFQVCDFDCTDHKAVIRKYSHAERGEVSSLRKKNPTKRGRSESYPQQPVGKRQKRSE